MKLVIIRHGQTDGNLQGILQGASINLPLNETGREQAKLAADNLEKFKFPIIYCSKLTRAKQTAEIIAEKLHCSVQPVDGLEEVHFGDAEGMFVEDAHEKYADIFNLINDETNPERYTVSIPNGETIKQCVARGVKTLQDISSSCPYEVAGVVTHGALMYNLYQHFFGESRRFHNCDFFEIEI